MSKRSMLRLSVYFEKWAEKVYVELLMLPYKIVTPTQMPMA